MAVTYSFFVFSSMNKPAVSILVPVYKVEKYLTRCLDSVLAQDFADWEMVLVDDGSPDRCSQICDEYAARDARIRVVHKENGGAMVARLVALQNSKADYVMFVDSDDWLLDGAIRTLYGKIAEGYDVVRSKVLRVDEEGKEWFEHYEMECASIHGGLEYVKAVFNNRIAPYLHSAIYRKQLFACVSLRPLIENKVDIGEDWISNLLMSPFVHSMTGISQPTYAYFYNMDSMMLTSVRSPGYVHLLEEVLTDFLSNASDEIRLSFQYKKMANYVAASFRPEIPFSKERYKIVRDFIRDAKCRAIMENYVPRKYLWGFRYYPFHRLYSKVYKMLYFNLVLKRRTRRVI